MFFLKKIKFLFIVLIAAVVVTAGLARQIYQTGSWQKFLEMPTLTKFTSVPQQLNLVQVALGLQKPRTYLILFLNNTELRPGGGFIGAYAVVKMNKANPTIVKVEGTEILDNSAPQDYSVEPPPPIKKYLKTPRWNFRDSNWSPDFKLSSQQALQLYKKEKGTEADNIDAVIGITPTVLEEILKISGPITADGQEFAADNFTAKLEYLVEYGYAKEGLSFDERKKPLANLMDVFIGRLRRDVFRHGSDYFNLLSRMLSEKQLVFYSARPDEQAALEANHWAGRLAPSAEDYLAWVDANMGALKTDTVMERQLTYSFAPEGVGFTATATMKFFNHGKTDWRTTRYLDYARVYVPSSSKLIGATEVGGDGQSRSVATDEGEENGRQWFGAYLTVGPGQANELSFHFEISPAIARQIKNNYYALAVQKQIGTLATPLTLRLNFGKNLVAASPAENADKQGDGGYEYDTDLRVNREFEIKLK